MNVNLTYLHGRASYHLSIGLCLYLARSHLGAQNSCHVLGRMNLRPRRRGCAADRVSQRSLGAFCLSPFKSTAHFWVLSRKFINTHPNFAVVLFWMGPVVIFRALSCGCCVQAMGTRATRSALRVAGRHGTCGNADAAHGGFGGQFFRFQAKDDTGVKPVHRQRVSYNGRYSVN